jgi:hypothetical protein
MKVLSAITLLALISCGGSSSKSKNDAQNQNAQKSQSRTCGYALGDLSCVSQADYVIESQKALPTKLKLTVAREASHAYEFMNECLNHSYKIERSANAGKIMFSDDRFGFYEATEILIQNCENDAVFFQGTLTPNIEVIPNDRDKATFTLNN